jgi:hypothetical protein
MFADATGKGMATAKEASNQQILYRTFGLFPTNGHGFRSGSSHSVGRAFHDHLSRQKSRSPQHLPQTHNALRTLRRVANLHGRSVGCDCHSCKTRNRPGAAWRGGGSETSSFKQDELDAVQSRSTTDAEPRCGVVSQLPFVNEISGLGLVLRLLPRSIEFTGEDLAKFIES